MKVGLIGIEHGVGHSLAAQLRRDTELRDVRNVGANARAEQEADHLAGTTLDDDARSACVEKSAARKSNDVVKEAFGASNGAVLVVDVRVYVARIGLMDELSGVMKVAVLPASHDEVAAAGEVVGNAGGGGILKVEFEQQPAVGLKSGGEECGMERAGWMQEEL